MLPSFPNIHCLPYLQLLHLLVSTTTKNYIHIVYNAQPDYNIYR